MSVSLNSTHHINFIMAHKLVDTLGFTLTPLVPIIAVLYLYKRTHSVQKLNKRIFFWLSGPFVINSILSIGSYHFNWIFRITSQNMYVRGPLFFVSPLTSYIYYITYLLLIFDSRKRLNKEELIVLSLLSVFPAVMSIFQLYYFIYLTIWNSIAIVVVINYILIIHSQTKLDPLTGLGNRLAYNEHLASLRRKRELVLSVINIDLDGFKSINDLYGHHEGDQVLQLFAGQLKDVFNEKGVVIRWGGDEFIVLMNENQKEAIEKCIDTLVDKINTYNESSNMPYRIEFSYGMTIFNRDYHSIDALIEHSDQLMYKEKRSKSVQSM